MVTLRKKWAIEDEGHSALDGARLATLLEFYDPISIDSFLAHYSSDSRLISAAKRAITHIVISKGTSVNFKRTKPSKESELFHWYRYLWDAIVKSNYCSLLARGYS